MTWADWDEEALALELQDLQEADFDLSLTGFNPGEIDDLLALDDEEKANATPPLPETAVARLGDLWLLGLHRVLCGDATSAEAVTRLLGERKPRLMVTDPPYGIELDSEWRVTRSGATRTQLLENFAVDDHGMLLAVTTCASTGRWGFLRALTCRRERRNFTRKCPGGEL